MNSISQILQSTNHRPWQIPTGNWSYYQEWNNALFLHWKVPITDLAHLVPGQLNIDTYNGEAWISIVAFTMEKIRPKELPYISAISNFHEINVRTYLTDKEKPGVYFLNIEAEKHISTFIAKSLSGLPYEKSEIKRRTIGEEHQYKSANRIKEFGMDASFRIGAPIHDKSELDKWLTERYCLYFEKNETFYRYETHHKEWELETVDIQKLISAYKVGNISLDRKPDLVHYSPGVKVIAWKRQLINLQN